VQAMHPYYVIRAIGGLLYLTGTLIMVYNVWRTIRGDVRSSEPLTAPTAAPAAAAA
jgi:cytochrome c oxidase cbb3-type subunit I